MAFLDTLNRGKDDEAIKKEIERAEILNAIKDDSKIYQKYVKNAEEIGTIYFFDNSVETSQETLSIFSGFHAEEVLMHEEPDEYFAGLRAYHFAIEIGYSEFSYECGLEIEQAIMIVTANHKGTRISKLLEINP